MMLLILFASWIPILPVSGMTTIGAGYTGFAYVLDVAHHLILPVVTLAILYIAQYSRMERASMIDILGTDYIRTARAKGLRERTVVYKHALKNALIPVVTLAGMQFSQVFAGAVLVETVFNWPRAWGGSPTSPSCARTIPRCSASSSAPCSWSSSPTS